MQGTSYLCKQTAVLSIPIDAACLAMGMLTTGQQFVKTSGALHAPDAHLAKMQCRILSADPQLVNLDEVFQASALVSAVACELGWHPMQHTADVCP